MKKTTRYKNLEKIVLSHFPDAKWNDKNQRWEAETRPNKKDSWDKPESLAEFEKEADKSFYSYMSGTGWDNAGNITITVRNNIFESAMKNIPTLEEFIIESYMNEAKDSVTFSINDEKLDQLLHDHHGRELDYVKIRGDEFYSLPKREFDRFIAAADSKGFDEDSWSYYEESVKYVNEGKIIYQKGKSYQTGNGWVVYADKSNSGIDIKVNNSAGWQLDPHDTREEDFILMDAGRQRASIRFKEGNINAFAKKMWDMNDKTTWGEKQGLTADDYADIIRVWIDMRNETRK